MQCKTQRRLTWGGVVSDEGRARLNGTGAFGAVVVGRACRWGGGAGGAIGPDRALDRLLGGAGGAVVARVGCKEGGIRIRPLTPKPQALRGRKKEEGFESGDAARRGEVT